MNGTLMTGCPCPPQLSSASSLHRQQFHSPLIVVSEQSRLRPWPMPMTIAGASHVTIYLNRFRAAPGLGAVNKEKSSHPRGTPSYPMSPSLGWSPDRWATQLRPASEWRRRSGSSAKTPTPLSAVVDLGRRSARIDGVRSIGFTGDAGRGGGVPRARLRRHTGLHWGRSA